MAKVYLIGGAVLALVSLLLWFFLPIASTLPPFLLTPLLALGYGAYCWWRTSRATRPKP